MVKNKYMSWYRQYRPTQVKGLHLKTVRQALQQMMKTGKIPQALLFAGPRGTGKTSSARILGALLNDPQNQALVDHLYFAQKKPQKLKFAEPDDQTEFAQKVYQGHSYVVQEMDAASHRGIDDIRSLKERVQLPPAQGKMAVFILDEAHMLTTEAFNALLKLLEEPPPHVVFILATTEFHKIPATIASRCSVIEFHKASEQEIAAALKPIIKKEKIKADSQALNLLIKRADGSFRDAVKMLERASSSGQLTLKEVELLLSDSGEQVLKELLLAVLRKDATQVSKIIAELKAKNTDYKFFVQSLFEFLHLTLMQHLGLATGKVFDQSCNQRVTHFLLQELQQADLLALSPMPFLPLELKLLELIYRAQNKQTGSSNNDQGSSANPVTKNNQAAVVKKSTSKKTSIKSSKKNVQATKLSGNQSSTSSSSIITPPQATDLASLSLTTDQQDSPQPTSTSASSSSQPKSLTQSASLQNKEQPAANSHSQLLFQQWEQFVTEVAGKNATLAALLRSAKPIKGHNGLAQVGVYYRFHQEQLQHPRFLQLIEECSQQVVGSKVKFEFLLQKQLSPSAAVKKAAVKTTQVDDDLVSVAEEALM
ncbi:MAG: DNA polymerase III subunit gamma/tau [Candidatus Pacebacteria bacterium]|nr:DNA polymerase III subunit gamma/tau [Candidatus Paceibacterota bacterium]